VRTKPVPVGVDGCPGGWVLVALLRSGPVAAHISTIDQLSRAVPGATVVGVDIPIGLVERGHRSADLAGRDALGPRRSTIFLTPVRAAVEAGDHARANAIERKVNGRGVSRQAFGLSARILEVERWVDDVPFDVFEVHPELSFAAMAGAVLRTSKRTWAGAVERREALARAGIDVGRLSSASTGPAAVDDVLDAAAVAWTAGRIALGQARSYPDPPERLPTGKLMAIRA
jgi:predicted RNase H-like nuclease